MDYLKEYADDNGIKVSDILKYLGYDGVHDGSEWVAFDSSQLKSADPLTYDDKGNVIPLSERFDKGQQDIRYQSRIDIDKALDPSERGNFYKSLMPNNQREFYRIGDNAILVPNESNNREHIKEYKLVFYSGDHVDYEITDVYKISNYEYNIHDKKPNAFEFLVAREKKLNEALSIQERRKIDDYTRAVLENSSVYFGTVFSRYNGKSNIFNVFARGGRKAVSNNPNRANGTGISGGTQQTGGIKHQDRFDALYGDDDLFSDDTAVQAAVVRQYATHAAEIGEALRNTADIGAASIRSLQIKEKQTPYDKRKTVASVKRQSFAVNS